MLASPCGQNKTLQADRARGLHVLVCDESLNSRAVALAAVEALGAAATAIHDFASLELLARGSRVSGTALIALDHAMRDGASSVTVIKFLHQRGFSIIGYDEGIGHWPLARRCRFLLNGCSCLLDTGAATFAAELRRVLEKHLLAHQEKAVTDEALEREMAPHGVVGESREMLAVFASVIRISPLSDLPTLITGESGTGKELLARAIHARDPKRRAGPFVALNCGTIPAALAETELFGHRRGAFTGAERDRRGHIRAAHGGVLFLDEIAELAPAIQVKLLRVLQDNRVAALGDEHEAPVSVRVIAATNGNLSAMVNEHTFRADLFHRLNVLSIHIPPVRERRDDIPPLVTHFARKHQMLNVAGSDAVAAEFVEALDSLRLPGNARQIENLVRAALVHNDGTAPLGLADLPAEVWQELAEQSVPSSAPAGAVADPSVGWLEANNWSLSRTLRACERSFLQAALSASNGNQSKTARLLGITPRSVYNKLRRHHLS